MIKPNVNSVNLKIGLELTLNKKYLLDTKKILNFSQNLHLYA